MKFIVVLLACVLAAEGASKFGVWGVSKTDNQNPKQDESASGNPPGSFNIPKVGDTVGDNVIVGIEVQTVPAVANAIYPTRGPSVPKITSDDGSAKTITYENEINNDGHSHFFETTNGIREQAKFIPHIYGNPPKTGISGQGYFSWTSPEGKFIEVHYTADENGYQPTGNAIPVVSAQMARALEYGARYIARNKN